MDEDAALQYYSRLQLEVNLSDDNQLGDMSSANVSDDEADGNGGDGNGGADMEAQPVANALHGVPGEDLLPALDLNVLLEHVPGHVAQGGERRGEHSRDAAAGGRG